MERAKKKRAELMALTDAYRAHYRDAYHILRAADEVGEESRASLHTHMDVAKLERRMRSIAARELKGKRMGNGGSDDVFLGGVTHRGDLCRFDTVEALCPRVYELRDSAGLGNGALQMLRTMAVESGERALACRNPDRPAELQHLLLPGRGVAFVTSNERIPYGGEAYRRIRLDAMAEETLERTERVRLRFLRRVERELRTSAVEKLADAKRAHDALEGACNPLVDFDGVYALAQAEARRLMERA